MISAQINDTTINIGDVVRVRTNVIEGSKTRVQTFEGLLIALRGRGDERMMTVRKIGARAIGVERIWPINSRAIVGVDVVKKAKKIRRSKLYYLRGKIGKAATQI